MTRFTPELRYLTDYWMGYAARTTYRRPSRVRRVVNGCVAWLAGQGFTPVDTVRLEVAGRKTGRPRAFAVTMAYCGGENYLVSLAGESDWVRNLRAADGKAVIQHRRRFDMRALELPPDARAPVLAAYLSKRALSKSAVAAARDYFGVDAHPSLEALQGIADHYPVFKVIGITRTLSGQDESQHR